MGQTGSTSVGKADIQNFLRAMVKAAPKPRGSIQVQLDVDPQSFV